MVGFLRVTLLIAIGKLVAIVRGAYKDRTDSSVHTVQRSQAKRNDVVLKVKPDGYQVGHGTGFTAGEKHSGM